MNRTVEQILRIFIDPRMHDRYEHLLLVEFVINNAKSKSTGFTPFFWNAAQHLSAGDALRN